MDRPATPSELLSVREVAALLSLSPPTVWRRVEDGSLPKPVKIGRATRWVRGEIDAAIETAMAARSSTGE